MPSADPPYRLPAAASDRPGGWKRDAERGHGSNWDSPYMGEQFFLPNDEHEKNGSPRLPWIPSDSESDGLREDDGYHAAWCQQIASSYSSENQVWTPVMLFSQGSWL